MAARNIEVGWHPHIPVTPIEKARAVVRKLVFLVHKDKFRKKVGIEVTEVFEGGSLGHGTTVEDHFDIDLVLYSRSLTVEGAVEKGYDDYFDKIDSYLSGELKETYNPEDEYTDVAIKFEIKEPGERAIGIDFILSPYFPTQLDLLESLRRVEKSKRLKLFSASASKWQTDFLRHKHCWVKELIRRAKAWRDIQWSDCNDGRPKSYFMSILVIIAYERLPAGMRVTRKKGLRKLIRGMTSEFKALIQEICSNRRLDLSVPGADRGLQDTYRDLLPDCPRIVDPINPANNLYLSGILRCKSEENKWGPFLRKVDSLDLKPWILIQHRQQFGR